MSRLLWSCRCVSVLVAAHVRWKILRSSSTLARRWRHPSKIIGKLSWKQNGWENPALSYSWISNVQTCPRRTTFPDNWMHWHIEPTQANSMTQCQGLSRDLFSYIFITCRLECILSNWQVAPGIPCVATCTLHGMHVSHDVSCKAISLVQISQPLIRKSAVKHFLLSWMTHIYSTQLINLIKVNLGKGNVEILWDQPTPLDVSGKLRRSKTDLPNLSIPGFSMFLGSFASVSSVHCFERMAVWVRLWNRLNSWYETGMLTWIIKKSSTAQGGGGSFKKRKTIGEIGCCESRMSKQKHWPTD